MNWSFLTHLVIGAMGIGAYAVLAALHTISGGEAVTGIGTITGVLLGTGAAVAVVNATGNSANTQQQQQQQATPTKIGGVG